MYKEWDLWAALAIRGNPEQTVLHIPTLLPRPKVAVFFDDSDDSNTTSEDGEGIVLSNTSSGEDESEVIVLSNTS